MSDAALVLRHIFDWRFFTSLSVLLLAGLLLPPAYLKPFRSVRFNIWLFAVIAAVSIAGTFFPEANIYHSWYFSSLLALMAFDVVACKLRTLPVLIHGPLRSKDERSVSALFHQSRFKSNFTTAKTVDAASRDVAAWLRDKKMAHRMEAVRAPDGAGATGFFAARHRIQRWGDMILHVSIVIVLAGGLMGALYGFEEVLAVPEGSSLLMKNRPYEVAVEDFDIQYYPTTGVPSRYASLLVVRKHSAEIARRRIVVNEPLDVDRVRFYQASWGMTPQFRSAVLRIAGRDVVVKPGELTPLGGTPLSVRANRVAPTFEVTAEGRPRVADFEGRNPALQLDFFEGDALRVSIWLLFNKAEAYRIEGERVVAAPPPPFQWVGFEPILFSGIQIGYDPGAPLFWFGSILLMAGLCSHFYLHQRRLRIAVVPTASGSEIRIGGWNSRTPAEFEAEYASWVDELRQRLA